MNENLNGFTDHITSAGVDGRIILIGRGLGLCISPPLAAPACQSNPPQFVAIDSVPIASYDGLAWVIRHYDGWPEFGSYDAQNHDPGCPKFGYSCESDTSGTSWKTVNTPLRTDAVLHFVAVTDDNAFTIYAKMFRDGIVNKMRPDGYALATPEVPHGYVFHSIVGYTLHDLQNAGLLNNSRTDLANTPTSCPTMQRFGRKYVQLSIETGGAIQQVCQSDWTSMFRDVLSSLAHLTLLTWFCLPDCECHCQDGIASMPPKHRVSQ